MLESPARHSPGTPQHCTPVQSRCALGVVCVPPPRCIAKFLLCPHCISCVLCPQGESGEPGPKGQVSDGGFGSEGLPSPSRWVALRDPQPEAFALTKAAALHGAGACCMLVA